MWPKWSHKHTLEAAERVRLLVEGGDLASLVRQIQDDLPKVPTEAFYMPRAPFDCTCPPSNVCMNTACPRMPKVVCS